MPTPKKWSVYPTFQFHISRNFGESLTDKLPLKEFLDGVGHLKFRGTSLLFRLSTPLNEIVAKKTRQSSHLAKKRFVSIDVMVWSEGVGVTSVQTPSVAPC